MGEGGLGGAAGSVLFCYTCSKMRQQKKTGESGIARATNPQLASGVRKLPLPIRRDALFSVPEGILEPGFFPTARPQTTHVPLLCAGSENRSHLHRPRWLVGQPSRRELTAGR